MKILYAIQGTGNGHLSRARDIVPLLQKKGELDILISGIQADISLPYPIKYSFKGLSFIFGKKGGVDLMGTYLRNNSLRIMREIKSVPIEKYDIIINDFEPISAWAAHLKKKPCISLSHQSAVLSKNAPVPKKKDRMGRFILENYAPATAKYGFHFAAFDEHTYTPVIRQQVRELNVSDKGHYTVYLPSYSDEKLVKTFNKIKDVRWQVFSKHNHRPYKVENVTITPIDNEGFLESMASCSGILCGAGFETPAEALYLKKKLMVIPMKNQYEQYCNAAALESMGVPTLKNLKEKQLPLIKDWIEKSVAIDVHFPDMTADIIDLIVEMHTPPPAIHQLISKTFELIPGLKH